MNKKLTLVVLQLLLHSLVSCTIFTHFCTIYKTNDAKREHFQPLRRTITHW